MSNWLLIAAAVVLLILAIYFIRRLFDWVAGAIAAVWAAIENAFPYAVGLGAIGVALYFGWSPALRLVPAVVEPIVKLFPSSGSKLLGNTTSPSSSEPSSANVPPKPLAWHQSGIRNNSHADGLVDDGERYAMLVPESVLTLTTPTPPPPRAKQPIPLMWNAWVEPNATTLSYRPLTSSLIEGGDYTVAVDLAALAYRTTAQQTSIAFLAKSSLRNWIDQQIEKRKNNGNDTVTLKALILSDGTSLQANGHQFVNLTVNLAAIDRYENNSPALSSDPWKDLRDSLQPGAASPPFRFGGLDELFHIHVLDQTGPTYFAVSFWSGTEPVDSIVFNTCVASSDAGQECKNNAPENVGVSNNDRWNVGAPDPGTESAAASLHFVEVPKNTYGVLLAAGQPPVSWQLGKTVTALRDDIVRDLQAFSAASYDTTRADPDELKRSVGAAMLNTLIPPASSQGETPAQDPRKILEGLIAARVRGGSRTASAAPLIWVRVDPLDPEEIFSVPLALAAVGNDRQMMGDWFRVQSTLRRQDYKPLSSCIANWMRLLPSPGDTAFITTAATDLLGYGPGLTDNFNHDIGKFMRQMGAGPPVAKPTALLTLSHNSVNGLSFDGTHNIVPPATFATTFDQPSVAIIEGCDGALPGQDSFLRALNFQARIQAIVTTTGPIEVYLAAKYFALLSQQLSNHDYNLSQAHYAAVQQLETATAPNGGGPYGLRALIFSLLGDGSVRLCPDPARESTTH